MFAPTVMVNMGYSSIVLILSLVRDNINTMRNDRRSREDKTLVLALLRSSQLFFRSINPVIKSAGLTTSQWDVLETLHTKGELSINNLMRLMLSTSGNLDVVIKNLMQTGLVEKAIDEKDRRGRIVRLTEAGEAKVEKFLPEHNRALSKIFSGLTNREKQETIRTLNRLRKQLTCNQKGDAK